MQTSFLLCDLNRFRLLQYKNIREIIARNMNLLFLDIFVKVQTYLCRDTILCE